MRLAKPLILIAAMLPLCGFKFLSQFENEKGQGENGV
jgi:hypothetical protein